MDLSRGLGKTLSSGRQPQHQITSTAAKIAAPYGPLPTSKRQRSPSITSNKVRSKRKAVEEEEEEKEEEEKEEEEELPSADHIIASMTEHMLRDFLLKLVRESSVENIVKTRLFAQERTVLDQASLHIVVLSHIAAMDAKRDAIAAKGTAQFWSFSWAMQPHLAEIEWLIPSSDALGGLGLDLAWNCLYRVAGHAIVDMKEEGRPMVIGEESDNDEFHEEIDEMMLDVCQKQAAALHVDWKGRMQNLEDLKNQSAGLPDDAHLPRLDYRYARTENFLRTLLDDQPGEAKGKGRMETGKVRTLY